MTCEHNWSRAGERWPPFLTCFWICVAAFDEAEFGQCRRLGSDGYRHCMARPTACSTAFPTSPAAQRWASCDDVATLRKRGQEYEHAWVKAAARELDLMIEIQRLKSEVAASKCAACCGTGLVAGEWLIDPTDPRYDNPPLCPCQNLEE